MRSLRRVDPTMAGWDSIPEDEKPFQRRLMEVAAGYAEHVDVQVGRLIDEIEALGYGENTLIFYVWGDNGSSAEGQNGTISELLAQNGIPTTTKQHIAALNALGGLDVLGTPLTDNQYHAGWAWAGSTPYKGTKLLASHFGGTRNPMAIRWPAKIKPDATPRTQFHHCNDIVPTIYEIVGINPPREVNGVPQDPIDGVSFAYTFDDPKAKGRLLTQYFEIMGSRAIYHDGWMACAFGPRLPWVPGMPPGIREWTPDKDVWELYDLDGRLVPGQRPGRQDAREARADEGAVPDRSDEEQSTADWRRSLGPASASRDALWRLPIRSGISPATSPACRSSPRRRLGNKPNLVTIEADIPANANGVLYKLGRNSGGLTLFVEDGILCYEYNLFLIMRTKIRATQKLPVGKAKIEVETVYVEPKPAGPLKVTIKVNGKLFASGRGPGQRSAAFHRQRLPRHRHRPGLAGIARLPRKGAIQVQRCDRQGERQVHSAADEISGRSGVLDARVNVSFRGAPCKGGVFQWVKGPPGNCSSRKLPEQLWR